MRRSRAGWQPSARVLPSSIRHSTGTIIMDVFEMPIEWLLGPLLIVVSVVLVLSRSLGRTKIDFKKSEYSGPQDVRFTCAKCSKQFNHSRRTIVAWEKGSRRIFCNGCHKKWIDARPDSATTSSAEGKSEGWSLDAQSKHGQQLKDRIPVMEHQYRERNRGRHKRSGCLGVIAILIVPVIAVLALR